MTAGGFAHPEYLVDAAWVAAHKDDANVVVIDGDVEASFVRGHIPAAVMIPDNYEKDPESGRVNILPPAKFAEMCQNLGIGDDTLVIAYDGTQSLYAARLWWALNYYGHTNVKVLDGGWRAWVNNGGKISFDRPAVPASVKFTPKADESVMVKVDELKAACSLADSLIWDVRSDGEYDGSNSRGNQRVGHVPGAVHLEWFNLVDRDSHCLKSPEEILRILNDKGITPDKAVFAY